MSEQAITSAANGTTSANHAAMGTTSAPSATRRSSARPKKKQPPQPENPSRIAALTTPQTIAVDALVAGKSVVEAAAAAEVSRDKLESWLTNAAFLCSLERARRQAWDANIDRMRRLAGLAMAALESVLLDSLADPRAKVAAAALALRAVGLTGETQVVPAAPRDAITIQHETSRKLNSIGLDLMLAD